MVHLTRRALLAGAALAPLAARASGVGPEMAIVGYNDMAEMIAGLDAAFAALHPGTRFRTELRGTRFGPAALAEGRAIVAPMGALFTPAQRAAYRAIAGRDPLAFRIAHASLSPKALSGPNGVFVHRDNPLRDADLPTLATVFTQLGPHAWAKLGGGYSGKAIRVAGTAPDTPLALEMQAALFPRRPFASDMEGFRQSRDVVALVASDPLALGFAAINRAQGPVRALGLRRHPGAPALFATEATLRAGAYPLDRHLWLYARKDRHGRLDPLARAYVALALSPRGQAVIGSGSLGYLPLGPDELRRERARLV
jgi:phosphate transport system substrate-binding protein